MDWQPIETAPQDGTRVDVWYKGEGRLPDAYFKDGRWLRVREYRQNSGGGSWYPVSTSRGGVEPTHWMPLPEPPK